MIEPRDIERRKPKYRLWQEHCRVNPDGPQVIPLAMLKWMHVGKETDYYLIELYNVVDEMSAGVQRLREELDEMKATIERLEVLELARVPHLPFWRRWWGQIAARFYTRKRVAV